MKETEGVPEKDGTVWPGLGAERGQQGAGGLLLHAARQAAVRQLQPDSHCKLEDRMNGPKKISWYAKTKLFLCLCYEILKSISNDKQNILSIECLLPDFVLYRNSTQYDIIYYTYANLR